MNKIKIKAEILKIISKDLNKKDRLSCLFVIEHKAYFVRKSFLNLSLKLK